MFALILTVLHRDYRTPIILPIRDCWKNGGTSQVMGQVFNLKIGTRGLASRRSLSVRCPNQLNEALLLGMLGRASRRLGMSGDVLAPTHGVNF